MAERTEFNLPIGRWTHGSITEKRDKDNSGRPIDPDKQTYQFGVAVRKDNPQLPALFQKIIGAAYAAYAHAPHIQQRIAAWSQTMSGFSMKISDGDAPNDKGQVNENTKGCFCFWFSTSFPLVTCDANNTRIDPALIKRGYYVDIAGNVAGNTLVDNNAGIYMNASVMRLCGEGDEIAGSVDPATAFGGQGANMGALPPGARPVGSGPSLPPGAGAPGTGLPGAYAPPPGPGALAPVPPPPAAFPPPGWTAHPSAPGYYYMGQEVLAELDLRARYPAPLAGGLPGAPMVTPPLAQGALAGGLPGMGGAGVLPGAPGIASHGNGIQPYPGILGGGLPGMTR